MFMSDWTPDIIRFMEDASSRSNYFQLIANRVRDCVSPGESLCDVGCGMGQLSLELSPHVGSVWAIDRSAAAVEYLQHEIDRRGIRNATACVEDFSRSDFRLDCDCAVFCLSASLDDAINLASGWQCGTLFVVNKVRDAPAPGACGRHLEGEVSAKVAEVRQRGLMCDGEEMVLEYGQPFRTIDDAIAYFKIFRTVDYPDGVSECQLANLLTETGDAVFPYYLPVQRKLALFKVDMGS